MEPKSAPDATASLKMINLSFLFSTNQSRFPSPLACSFASLGFLFGGRSQALPHEGSDFLATMLLLGDGYCHFFLIINSSQEAPKDAPENSLDSRHSFP